MKTTFSTVSLRTPSFLGSSVVSDDAAFGGRAFTCSRAGEQSFAKIILTTGAGHRLGAVGLAVITPVGGLWGGYPRASSDSGRVGSSEGRSPRVCRLLRPSVMIVMVGIHMAQFQNPDWKTVRRTRVTPNLAVLSTICESVKEGLFMGGLGVKVLSEGDLEKNHRQAAQPGNPYLDNQPSYPDGHRL